MRYFIVMVLFFTSTLQAATYYVDDANGLDANDGSNWEESWKTIGAAKAVAVSGDTVNVKNGSYGTYEELSYTNRTDWVTYQAATGHHPVLTHIKVTNTKSPTNGNSYLAFDGFTITTAGGANNYGVYFFSSNYLKILNCTITCAAKSVEGFYAPYWGSDTADYCFYGRGATNVTIQDCNLSNCYQAIQFSSYGTSYVNNESITIHGNTIHNIAADGISVAASHMTIEDNLIYDIDCRRSSIGIVGTISGTFTAGEGLIQETSNATGVFASQTASRIYAYLTSEAEFEGTNTSENSPDRNGTITGQSSGKTVTSVTTIDAAHTDGIEITSLAGGEVAQHSIIMQRNKIHRLNPAPYIQNTQTIKFDGGRGYEFHDVNVTNNVFSGCDIQALPIILAGMDNLIFNNNTLSNSQIRLSIVSYEGSCIISQFYNNIISGLAYDDDDGAYYTRVVSNGNNLFGTAPIKNGGGTATYPYDVNEATELTGVTVADLFVDSAAYDFNLVTGSSAINAGYSVYGPSTDILDMNRVGATDIGAYEYQLGGGGNNAPVLDAIGAQSGSENDVLTFDADATDEDLDELTYSCDNLPTGATINSSTGVVTWTPSYSQAGTWNLNIVVSDGTDQDSEVVTVTVANRPQGLICH